MGPNQACGSSTVGAEEKKESTERFYEWCDSPEYVLPSNTRLARLPLWQLIVVEGLPTHRGRNGHMHIEAKLEALGLVLPEPM